MPIFVLLHLNPMRLQLGSSLLGKPNSVWVNRSVCLTKISSRRYDWNELFINQKIIKFKQTGILEIIYFNRIIFFANARRIKSHSLFEILKLLLKLNFNNNKRSLETRRWLKTTTGNKFRRFILKVHPFEKQCFNKIGIKSP